MDQKTKKENAIKTCNLNMVKYMIKQNITFDEKEIGRVLTKMCEINNLQIRSWIEEFKQKPTKEEMEKALEKSIEEENFNKIKRWIDLGASVTPGLFEKKALEKDAANQTKLAQIWREYGEKFS
jgi:hypothetical protein